MDPKQADQKYGIEKPYAEPGVYVSDAWDTSLVAKVYGETPEQIQYRARLIKASPVLLDAVICAMAILNDSNVRHYIGKQGIMSQLHKTLNLGQEAVRMVMEDNSHV